MNRLVNFRQSMNWLHTWAGLWFGWLLIAIFITGTLTVFHPAITHWMQPEMLQHEWEEAAELAARPPAVSPLLRLAAMQADIEQQRNHFTDWARLEINFDDTSDRYYWWQHDIGLRYDDGSYRGALGGLEMLDNSTAHPPQHDEHEHPETRSTRGGGFFLVFHYALTGAQWGLWAVAIASLLFVVTLVTGVVVHKKIFSDFFTFRAFKQLRSWLDLHNVLGVMTLPFLLMISYSGLVLLMRFDVSTPGEFIEDIYKKTQQEQKPAPVRLSTAEGDNDTPPLVPSDQPLPALIDIATVAGQLMQQQQVDINWVNLDRLKTTSPLLYIAVAPAGKYTFAADIYKYDAISGQLLAVQRDITPFTVHSVLRQLHLLRDDMDTPLLRWLYFIASAAGAGMMAVGSVMFMVKRRKKANEFGRASPQMFRLLDTLNVAAISGLCIACISYLWLNRLLPLELAKRGDYEVSGFYLVWLACLLHALLRRVTAGQSRILTVWFEQCVLLGTLCLLLPLVNWLTEPLHLFSFIQNHDWQAAGVELTAVVLGMAFLLLARSIHRKQQEVQG